jgi:hypothetical protein
MSTYLNVDIFRQETDPVAIECRSNITRTNPIIDQSNNFYLEYLRSSIPTTSIPLFDFDSKKGETEYQWNLRYNGVNYISTIVFIPTTDQITNRNVYSPGEWINMLNVGLKESFDSLKLANPGIDSNDPPFLTQEESIVIFNIPVNFVGDGIQIFPTTNIADFTSFEFVYDSDADINLQWDLTYGPNALSKNIVTYQSINYLEIQGNYKTINTWNTVQKLRISTSLPIRSTLNGINDENFIIAEIFPSEDLTKESIFINTVKGEPLLIDLISTDGIYNVDIIIEWIDFSNKPNPIILKNKQSASVKLAFRPTNRTRNGMIIPEYVVEDF